MLTRLFLALAWSTLNIEQITKGLKMCFLLYNFAGYYSSSCGQLKSIIHATLATLDCYSNKNKVPLQIQLKVKAYVISLWCFQ